MAFIRRLMASKAIDIKNLATTANVIDDITQGVFFIRFDVYETTIDYEKDGHVYDLIHTAIPEGIPQGQGVGTECAKKVFDYLVAHKQKFRLSCEFLQHFYKTKGQKYKAYVVD